MKRKMQVGRPNQRTKIDNNRKATGGFGVRVGYATAAAAEISGDAAISCGLPSGSRALILSDGMGKGIKAAAGSRLVVSRLRKNLKEGMAVAKAIKEVNEYMIDHAVEPRHKDGANQRTGHGTGHRTHAGADHGTHCTDHHVGTELDAGTLAGTVHHTTAGADHGTVHHADTEIDAGHGTHCTGTCLSANATLAPATTPDTESFATVDLTIIDRKLCRAKFYKMGAATSFIVRGSRVRRIAKAALPVGIIPALKLTHISAQLKAGDIIVMVSDGITDADRNDLEANWLISYLSNYVEKINPNQGKINPNQGKINPNQGKNNPNQGRINPNQGRINPNQEKINPNQGKNNSNQGKINPNQGKNNSNQGEIGTPADIVSSVSPRALAADILREARQKYGTRERDDLTVAVAIIIDNEKNYEEENFKNNQRT